jgi:hypothetical protein
LINACGSYLGGLTTAEFIVFETALAEFESFIALSETCSLFSLAVFCTPSKEFCEGLVSEIDDIHERDGEGVRFIPVEDEDGCCGCCC